jgi:hypothetical protein
MKPIKCLLLLAAVLALAAMNAAAMEDPNHINQFYLDAIQLLRAGVPHEDNEPYNELAALARQAALINVPMAHNQAMALLVRFANYAASRTNLPPQDAYNLQADENVELCRNHSHMDFSNCVDCCTVKGHINEQRWTARIIPFMDYRGLCVCKNRPDLHRVSEEVFQRCQRKLQGQVVNPPQ